MKKLLTAHVSLTALTGLMYLILISSCSREVETSEAYIKEINQWHQQRIESLKKEDSWLSLAGLYWLEEGKNSFGSDTENDIVFPKDKSPSRIGSFTLKNGEVSVHIHPGTKVLIDEKPVTDTILTVDAREKPIVLRYGTLRWYVIERGDRTGIRLKDSENSALASFEGIDRFPVSAGWRVKARYIKFDKPKTITVPNIVGQVTEEPLYGTLEFNINGETYRLNPLGGPESDSFFIIFGDETNGNGTYEAGRFIYANKPNEDGITYIDFNKAYNPPCVFTQFATCPLPPAQNRLPVKVTAGEKNYKDGAMH